MTYKHPYERYREARIYSDNINQQLDYQHKSILVEINDRRELERLKEEITQDVLKQISVKIVDDATKQLKDALKQFGLN